MTHMPDRRYYTDTDFKRHYDALEARYEGRTPAPHFATREEACAHIREHKGSATYPGGTAIYRERMHV